MDLAVYRIGPYTEMDLLYRKRNVPKNCTEIELYRKRHVPPTSSTDEYYVVKFHKIRNLGNG